MSRTITIDSAARSSEGAFDLSSRHPIDAAGFAHELGNLIQVASSAVNIVARDIRAQDTSNLGLAIDGARASLERAGMLVRQSMNRAKGLEPDLGLVDVARSLDDLETLVQTTWTAETVVIVRADAGLPPVRCVPLHLHNSILNLVLNARDSMPDGGQITVVAKAVAHEGAPLVEISVTDEGIGMSPDTARRAFDPFFTTKSKGLGGLGLPMVRRFAEESGGRVTIESRPGIGTTVILQLPAWRDPTP